MFTPSGACRLYAGLGKELAPGSSVEVCLPLEETGDGIVTLGACLLLSYSELRWMGILKFLLLLSLLFLLSLLSLPPCFQTVWICGLAVLELTAIQPLSGIAGDATTTK